MGDAVAITYINAHVQENGIIRLNDTGRYIGRLDDVEYESLKEHKAERGKSTVEMDVNTFEHLLNCMCNQKFIHEQNAETQKDWQEIIDKSYHEARSILSPMQAESAI